MSDRTKAELETENEELQTENENLRTLLENKDARCPNCGFEAAEHQALIDAATTPA